MVITLSSRGQIAIPLAIRKQLKLKQGDRLQARIVNGQIVLEPIVQFELIEQLHGILADTNVLQALEDEHRHEVQNDDHLSV